MKLRRPASGGLVLLALRAAAPVSAAVPRQELLFPEGVPLTQDCRPGRGALPEELSCESLGWPRSLRRRLVVDAFAYNGEADVLEARRRELEGVVNGTAIVTTALSFKGMAHPVISPPHIARATHLLLNASAFEPCSLLQEAGAASKCRLSIAKNGLAEAVERFPVGEEDFVLFGDVDEIPHRGAVRLLHECEVPLVAGELHPGERHVLKLRSIAHYLYHTSCLSTWSSWYGSTAWFDQRGPAVLKVKTMRTYGLHAFQLKAFKPLVDLPICSYGPYATCHDYSAGLLVLNCSAWHLSAFGGRALVRRKISDNHDPSRIPSWKEEGECIEHNRFRQMAMYKLQGSNHRYPAVPHSVAADPTRFRMLMHQGARESHVGQEIPPGLKAVGVADPGGQSKDATGRFFVYGGEPSGSGSEAPPPPRGGGGAAGAPASAAAPAVGTRRPARASGGFFSARERAARRRGAAPVASLLSSTA